MHDVHTPQDMYLTGLEEMDPKMDFKITNTNAIKDRADADAERAQSGNRPNAANLQQLIFDKHGEPIQELIFDDNGMLIQPIYDKNGICLDLDNDLVLTF